MFLILFMKYSGRNILKFINSSCSIVLLRGGGGWKEVLTDFSDNTWRYCVLIQIAKFKLILEVEENCFEKNAHRNRFYFEFYIKLGPHDA